MYHWGSAGRELLTAWPLPASAIVHGDLGLATFPRPIYLSCGLPQERKNLAI